MTVLVHFELTSTILSHFISSFFIRYPKKIGKDPFFTQNPLRNPCSLATHCPFVIPFSFISQKLTRVWYFYVLYFIDKDEIAKKRKKTLPSYPGSNGFGGGGGGGEDGRPSINNFHNGGKWCMKTCRKNSTWIPYGQSVLQLLKIVMILEYIYGYLVVFVREKLQTKIHVFKLRQLTKMLKCQGKTSNKDI